MGGKSAPSGLGTKITLSSVRDSQDSVQSSLQSSQVNLACINCKHIPNRTNFLRLYYDVMRSLNSNNCMASCEVCGSSGSPLYACLQCIHFSCCRASDHYIQHNTESGHALSVEISTGVIRCIVCKVFVWNSDLERVHSAAKKGVLPGFLCQNSKSFDDDLDMRVFSKHCVGVRGLYNLGNTCFMNSVLQPLLHIPDLARFQLAYGPGAHRRDECASSQSGTCVACEFDALMVRMYNGGKKPVCPADMLYAVWKSAAEISGYEQQDAHEFFLCLRSSLHKALSGVHFNCNCIVHRLFSGVLQSDVSCPLCKGQTETYDPFLDISLDLLHHGDYMTSIEDCLEHFTRTEAVHMDAYKCSHCNQNVADVYKRMSIRAAPKILVMHLKRFESGASSSKIDRHVSFPINLDLHRHTPDYCEEDDIDVSVQPTFDMGVPGAEAEVGPHYRLFAVVSHVGTLDSGHYTCFQQYRDSWFHVDDANVTLATEQDVLNSQAYMLFYASLSSFGS